MRKNYLRAIPREWRTISRAFTALGDEHRQRILLTFEAGVLQSEKVGKEVYFWVDKQVLEESLDAVLAYIREKA